ncbi:hypothetical protein [Sinorhizobium meliloti]|uniref:hypothetical protein n=1 Tax=Rhizobium meliloti TaxID=382 RepID=UPI001F29EDB5|nr:hypothetical protein [Sinorhizobium meliloti]
MNYSSTGTRKPQLTAAGRAVLAKAHGLAEGIDGLRAKVKALHDGYGRRRHAAEERLGKVLRAFAEALRLHVEALGAVTAAVLDHNAIIGISGPLASGVRGVSASRRAPYQWPQWRHPITRSGAWSRPQAGIFSCTARVGLRILA